MAVPSDASTPIASRPAGLSWPPRTVWLSRFALVGITLLLFIAAALLIPYFFTWGNIANLLQRNSIIGIVACGMLLMIVLGGFDLSVGAVGAMTSVAAAYLIVTVSMPVGIVAALLIGLVIGLFNGFCIAKVGISPFVATLGTQVLITGILFVATSAQPSTACRSPSRWSDSAGSGLSRYRR